ncbi:hypothetical protein FRC01_008734 [Tulasnella sp. 417]|nr:hypothetical protein FRC01_008734 [Tulasnella sp. 417]
MEARWKFMNVLGYALDETLGDELGDALAGALNEALDEALGGALDEALNKALDKARKVANDLAQCLQVESSILRIVLWVWKATSGTQLDHSEKRNIFTSSCQLWAPLETRVDFTINGIEWGINGERLTFDDGSRDKLLTSEDMDRIVEFAEDLQRDREQFEFIARNADVGINRLYVHFNRRVDWNYDLFDLREQRTLCSRSTVLRNGLI